MNDGGQRTAAPLTPAPTLDGYLEHRAAYDHARIERYDEGAWGVYIRANLTNAYQNPTYQSTRPDGSRNRPKVSHVGREVVYLRGEGRRDAFVVFDRVVSTDASFKKAVLWHAREPFESRDRSRACGRRGDALRGWRDQYELRVARELHGGPPHSAGRLFVTAIAVDPIIVRGDRQAGAGAERRSRDVRRRTPPPARQGLLRRGPAQSRQPGSHHRRDGTSRVAALQPAGAAVALERRPRRRLGTDAAAGRARQCAAGGPVSHGARARRRRGQRADGHACRAQRSARRRARSCARGRATTSSCSAPTRTEAS